MATYHAVIPKCSTKSFLLGAVRDTVAWGRISKGKGGKYLRKEKGEDVRIKGLGGERGGRISTGKGGKRS